MKKLRGFIIISLKSKISSSFRIINIARYSLSLILISFIISTSSLVQASEIKKPPVQSRRRMERINKHNRQSRKKGAQKLNTQLPISKSSQLGFESDEFLLDTTVFYIPAYYDQYMASVAFDGTNYLVVWIDERKGDYDIYASRVSKDGVVLDPAGIFISSGLDYYSPSVAFDGTNYLVV